MCRVIDLLAVSQGVRVTPEIPSGTGRIVPTNLCRRWVGDMLHFAQRVPLVAGEGFIKVRAMAEARKKLANPPTWHSLAVKALGIASMKIPELRRAYLPYPWPRLYEAPYSVASVVFDREFQGEHATFFAPMLHPEYLPLEKIQAKVQAWKTDPIEAHGVLRRIVRNSKAPRPIRRLMWNIGLYWNGYLRARNFGTFAVNSVAAIRARMAQFLTPITSVTYYGSVTKEGKMEIQMAFDHRVFDGDVCAKTRMELEHAMNHELLEEVLKLAQIDGHKA
jgi:hypothetical protein